MSEPVRILIVEDNLSDYELAEREIGGKVSSCILARVETRRGFLDALEKFQPDLVLSDYSLPSFDGMEALKLLQEHAPLTPLILWTGSLSEDIAVESMKAGANNYVIKENIQRLGSAVIHALEERRLLLEYKQAEERIHNDEKRFRALIENGQDNISLLAEDGTLLWESPATIRSLGYSQDEFLGQNIFQLIHPDDLHWIHERLARLAQKPGSREEGTFRLRHRDGTWRWIEAVVTNLIDEPSVKAIVINYRDITERKRAADQLNYHARLLRHINDAVIATDNQLHITAWNRAAEKMYGWLSKEVIGRSVSEILSADFTDAQRAIARELLNETHISRSERIYRHKKGKTIYVEANTIALTNEHGKMTGYVSVHRDITERKQAEEIVLRLAAIVASSVDAIIGQSLAGTIVSWNPAAERLYRYSANEIIGQPASILFPPEQLDEAFRIIERLKAGEHMDHFETVRIRKDGQPIHVSTAVSSIKNANGELIGVSAIERDISERQRAEESLRRVSPAERGRRLSGTLREFAVLFVVGLVVVLGLSYYFNLFAMMAGALGKHELFDEIFFGLIYLVSSFTYFSYRRWKESDAEITKRRQIQEALRSLHSELELRVQERTADLAKTNIALKDEITERKQAEEQIQRQIQRLGALRTIDMAISSSFDLKITLDILLNQVVYQLRIDATDVLLLNPDAQMLVYIAGKGFHADLIETSQVPIGKSHAGRVAQERLLIEIENLRDQPYDPFRSRLLAGEDFVFYVGVPLITQGMVKGVLEVFHRMPLRPQPEWFDFLDTLAGQAAIAIENATLFENLQRSNLELVQAYDSTIEGWSAALDLRDKETEGHTQRVTEMSLRLAEQMGFGEPELMQVRRGALLHDIGKMGVPDRILLKPDKLTDEEWVLMRMHPEYAYQMLKPITYLGPALDIPYCHHEKWDGTGYPRGLKGEEIPLAARIFAIVDVYDALTSDRPYRKGWSHEKTLEHIRELSGSHFDQQVVEAFLKMIINE